MAEPMQGDVVDDGEPGALAALFEPRPRFRRRLLGYDRADVDDYVAWAQTRSVADSEASRCSGCNDAPPAPAAGPEGVQVREAVLVVGAMRELLRLAERRAAEIVTEAEGEAEQIRATARAEAETRLRNVADLRDATLERVRRQAEDLLREAAAERTRLAEETAAVAEEVADLRRRQDDARESLRLLTGRLGAALDGFVTGDAERSPAEPRRPGSAVLTGNVAMAEPRESVLG
jgi:colicin import membrane protein